MPSQVGEASEELLQGWLARTNFSSTPSRSTAPLPAVKMFMELALQVSALKVTRFLPRLALAGGKRLAAARAGAGGRVGAGAGAGAGAGVEAGVAARARARVGTGL